MFGLMFALYVSNLLLVDYDLWRAEPLLRSSPACW